MFLKVKEIVEGAHHGRRASKLAKALCGQIGVRRVQQVPWRYHKATTVVAWFDWPADVSSLAAPDGCEIVSHCGGW